MWSSESLSPCLGSCVDSWQSKTVPSCSAHGGQEGQNKGEVQGEKKVDGEGKRSEEEEGERKYACAHCFSVQYVPCGHTNCWMNMNLAQVPCLLLSTVSILVSSPQFFYQFLLIPPMPLQTLPEHVLLGFQSPLNPTNLTSFPIILPCNVCMSRQCLQISFLSEIMRNLSSYA